MAQSWRLPTLALMAAVWAGCGSVGDGQRVIEGIEVSDAYAAEPVSTDVAAVYLTIRNHGTIPDTLTGALAPIAGMVHLHRMAGGRAPMRAIEVIEVPAGGQLQLRPGSLHIMLMALTRRPRVGDTIEVTVQLAHAGDVAVRVPIVSYLEVGERAVVGTQDEPR